MSVTEHRSNARLKWLLLVAGAMLLLNLFSESELNIVAPSETGPSTTQHESAATAGRSFTASAEKLFIEPRPMIEPAASDPFSALAAVVPVAVKESPPPPTTLAPAELPAPSAPPLNASFAGKVMAPDGKQYVYVLVGDTTLAMVQGATLPNGYRVENIFEDSVEFKYAVPDTVVRLAIPPSPRQEIR